MLLSGIEFGKAEDVALGLPNRDSLITFDDVDAAITGRFSIICVVAEHEAKLEDVPRPVV